MSAQARGTNQPGPINAWAQLLANAPRLAKQIHDTPGVAAMLAKVFNSLELVARITGTSAERFDRFHVSVERDVPARRIVVKLR